MVDKDFPLFKEKLQEMNDIFRRDLPLTDAMTKHAMRVCKSFSLAVVRQACDDIIDTADFFPKPAELKRACERYGQGGTAGEVNRLRCAYIDHDRPRLPQDAFEFHWRCPAWFPLDGRQAYCPAHRPPEDDKPEYGEPATDEGINEVFAERLAAQTGSEFMRSVASNRAQRMAAGEPVALASLHALFSAIGKTMPAATDNAEVIQARKAGQLARAKAAGLLATVDQATGERVLENFHPRTQQEKGPC